MMDQNLRTRLQAARWLLDRVAARDPAERLDFLRSETDDELLIELVEGLLENETVSGDGETHETILEEIDMGNIDAADLLREINGIPRRLGEFDLSRPVGRGGMGSVFLAEHRSTGDRYAVKVALGETADAKEIKALFREVEIMQALSGRKGIPECLPVVTLDQEDQTLAYYAREFVRGTEVNDWITAVSPDLNRVLKLSIEACRVVESCHQAGVAHGDLKPTNILVDVDGCSIRLIDFGLAFRVDQNQLIQREPVGHPAFTAPEAKTTEPYDPKLADQFSMGATIFALLQRAESNVSLDLPPDTAGLSMAIQSSGLSGPIKATLSGMTAEDSADRFSSMRAAIDSLVQSFQKTTEPVSRRSKLRIYQPVLGILISSCVLILVLGGSWLVGRDWISTTVGDAPSPMVGDLRVAQIALEMGDVAMAIEALSASSNDSKNWFRSHLQARIRSIYDAALMEPAKSLVPDPQFKVVRRGEVLTAMNRDSGDLAYRWPVEPEWSVRGTSEVGTLVETESGILNLDFRAASAAQVVSTESLPGTMFQIGPGEIGWLNSTGSIVMHSVDGRQDRMMAVPTGLNAVEAAVASNGWDRLVLADRSPVVHVLGLGPALGFRSKIVLDGEEGPGHVLSIGQGHFLLHGGKDACQCWILGPTGTIRHLELGGSVVDTEAISGGGAGLLVRRQDVTELIEVSATGSLVSGKRFCPPRSDRFAFFGESSAILIGPEGLDVLAEQGQATATSNHDSLFGQVESLMLAGPRSLLLGGRWSGVWVFDPISRCLRGCIDTGGEEVCLIIGVPGRDDVFTQDASGFIRRIPA